MKNALLIAGRELASYLRSPLGFVIAAATAVGGRWLHRLAGAAP